VVYNFEYAFAVFPDQLASLGSRCPVFYEGGCEVSFEDFAYVVVDGSGGVWRFVTPVWVGSGVSFFG
jgi:hypothetical protein